MKATSLLYELEFKDTESKKAYLKANKWIAINIINKNLNGITWKITKLKNTETPTFKLQLFIEVDVKKEFERKCKVCKEFHCSFYINQQQNCDKCNAKAFLKTIQQKHKIQKKYNISKIQEGS